MRTILMAIVVSALTISVAVTPALAAKNTKATPTPASGWTVIALPDGALD